MTNQKEIQNWFDSEDRLRHEEKVTRKMQEKTFLNVDRKNIKTYVE